MEGDLANRIAIPALKRHITPRVQGIWAAISSAFFLGMAPIFGKQAILLGLSPIAVVAVRTTLAALMLLGVMAVFQRKFLFIYPAGLVGCLIAGWVNGLGSLFYYSALARIDAGVGQLLYSLYPLFLALWLTLDRQRISRMTLLRLSLALPAIFLLTQTQHGYLDLIGVIQMLIAAALYALHIPINQRVLLDMPAPTVTLYTLISMAALVGPTFFFAGSSQAPVTLLSGGFATTLTPVLLLALVTFLSRVMLFAGVKRLGSMQTALLGLSELLVALLMANLLLGESFSEMQWGGAVLLMVSLVLVGKEKPPARPKNPGGPSLLSMPGSNGIPWQPMD